MTGFYVDYQIYNRPEFCDHCNSIGHVEGKCRNKRFNELKKQYDFEADPGKKTALKMELDNLRNVWKKREFISKDSRVGKSTVDNSMGKNASHGVHTIIPSASCSEDDSEDDNEDDSEEDSEDDSEDDSTSHEDDHLDQEVHHEPHAQIQISAGVVAISSFEPVESCATSPANAAAPNPAIAVAPRAAGGVAFNLSNAPIETDILSQPKTTSFNGNKHVVLLSEGTKPVVPPPGGTKLAVLDKKKQTLNSKRTEELTREADLAAANRDLARASPQAIQNHSKERVTQAKGAGNICGTNAATNEANTNEATTINEASNS